MGSINILALNLGIRYSTAMNIFDSDQRMINGPYNAIRMEGEIDGLKKIVYMFMDVHMPPQLQTECANIYSQDFNRFLAETFHDLNGADRMYDFFMEIDPELYKIDSAVRAEAKTKQSRGAPRDKYIRQVWQLLRSSVEYDSKGDHVSASKVFQNVRLHYLDIRGVLSDLMFGMFHLPIHFGVTVDYHPSALFLTLGRIYRTVNHCLGIYQDLKANPEAVPRSDDEKTPESELVGPAFGRYVRKLLYGYKHADVKRLITARVDRYFGMLKDFTDMIDDFAKLLAEYGQYIDAHPVTFYGDNGIRDDMTIEDRVKWNSDIAFSFNQLTNQIMIAGVGITDCYLLRRVLDKDYVTNAITYTGGSHTVNYVNALVGDFGFTVTNISATPADSVTELNRTIKERLSKGDIITDLLVPIPYSQCSDLTDFPLRFL